MDTVFSQSSHGIWPRGSWPFVWISGWSLVAAARVLFIHQLAFASGGLLPNQKFSQSKIEFKSIINDYYRDI